MLRQHTPIGNRMLLCGLLVFIACGCAALKESANRGAIKTAAPGTQMYVETFSWPSAANNIVDKPVSRVPPELSLQPSEGYGQNPPVPLSDREEWRYGNFEPEESPPSSRPESASSQNYASRYNEPPAPAPLIPAVYRTNELSYYQPSGSSYLATAKTYDGDWVSDGYPVSATGGVSEVSYSTHPAGAPAISSLPTAVIYPVGAGAEAESQANSQNIKQPAPEPLEPTDNSVAGTGGTSTAAALAAQQAEAEALAQAKAKAEAAAAAAAAAKDDGLADASIRLNYEGDYIVNKSRSVVLSIGYGLNQAELAEQIRADLARLGHVDGNPLTDDIRLNPEAVTAELTAAAEAFKITSGPTKTRALLFGKPNQWQWNVVPLAEGPQQLTLTLSWALPGVTDGKPQVFQRAYQVSVSVDGETFWKNLVGKITEHSKLLTAMLVALLALIVAAMKLWKTVRTNRENG